MTRADDPDQTGTPPDPRPFRFDSGPVQLEPLPEQPPLTPGEPSQDADPDAAIAARMARIQQRLDSLKKRSPSGAPGSSGMAKLGHSVQWWIVGILGLSSALVVIIAYLAMAVPGPWFPANAAQSFGATSLQLVRGHGELVGGALIVSAPADDGVAVISINGNLRADRIRGIAWSVTGVPDTAKVGIAWRSDVQPGRTYGLPAIVDAGRLRPVIVSGAPGWIGNINGLGLVVAGTFVQPIRVVGVTAKPMGAIETLRDRAGEWLAFEGWSGTSVNVIAGGADAQDLPLPPLVAAIVALGAALLLGLRRWRPHWVPNAALGIGIFFVVGWFVLDLRWSANLVRQVATTWSTFGGKSEREKHLADADGQLFQFIESVRAALPPTPQRIWVVSDAPYFSGRAAYHLYPHNIHFQPRGRAMPDRAWVKPGDWLLVFNRRGVEFNEARHTLRWDGATEVAADLKTSGAGAALFLIR
jgi:hypothetical protein